MPLEDILQEVEKRKDQEIKKISEEYETKIGSVNSEVEEELQRLEAYYSRKLEEDSRALREREVELAKMEAKGLEREKISQLMNNALQRADFFLRNIADTREYSQILRKMVNLSMEILGENCIVHARKADLSFLQDMNRIRIAKDHIKEPGIIAESSDGNRELDLTIGTVMDDLREKISLEFVKHLGED